MSSKGEIYFDRKGSLIGRDEWAALRGDPDYCTICEYDNGVVYIKVEWVGAVSAHFMKNTLSEYWPRYKIRVANYNADGNLMPDPIENGKTFSSEEEAVKVYERFLLAWTECDYDESGKFTECDNDLAPLPPPDPNAPASDISAIKGLTDDGIGAW
jgi:hypothetical protein